MKRRYLSRDDELMLCFVCFQVSFLRRKMKVTASGKEVFRSFYDCHKPDSGKKIRRVGGWPK